MNEYINKYNIPVFPETIQEQTYAWFTWHPNRPNKWEMTCWGSNDLESAKKMEEYISGNVYHRKLVKIKTTKELEVVEDIPCAGTTIWDKCIEYHSSIKNG